MIALQYTTWSGESRVLDLAPGRWTLGRAPDNDLVVDELEVEEHHCEIVVDGDGVRVLDPGSLRGISVDGVPVRESSLRAGQTLGLGTFFLQAGPSGEGRGGGAPSGTVRLADGSFSCLKHADARAEYECGKCHGLFCSRCFPGTDGKVCPGCGRPLRKLDWPEEKDPGFWEKLRILRGNPGN